MALIGGIIGGASKVIQGGQAEEQANMAALDLEKQALELERRGKIRKERVRAEGRRFIGDQTAAIAASGVQVSGSPLAGLVESQYSIREEIEDIDRNLKQEKEALLTGARRYRQQGRQAFQAGALGGFASFAGSLTQTGKQAGGII